MWKERQIMTMKKLHHIYLVCCLEHPVTLINIYIGVDEKRLK